MHETEPDPALAPVMPLPAAEPKPKKVDGRSTTAQANGMKGGHPYNVIPFTPEETLEKIKQCILNNGTTGVKAHPQLGPVSIDDRQAIQRICKMNVEEFNARLADKLGEVADLLVDSIRKDVVEGKFKPGEKSFALAISIDKRNALDGRLAVSGANVQILVNNFNGPISRDELLKRLGPAAATIPAAADTPAIPV